MRTVLLPPGDNTIAVNKYIISFGYCYQPIVWFVCYTVVAASGLEAINHRQERPRIFSLHPGAQLLNKQTSNYKEKQTVSTPSNWMMGVLNSCVKTVVVYRTGQDMHYLQFFPYLVKRQGTVKSALFCGT